MRRVRLMPRSEPAAEKPVHSARVPSLFRPRRLDALELARSLKSNYAQLGDADGVNAAIAAELQATRVHRHKAAWSKESYYRSKYTATKRVGAVFSHASFVLLDWLWGNGESIAKVLRAILTVQALLILLLWFRGQPIGSALLEAPQLSLGLGELRSTFPGLAALATLLRFFFLGLFISVIVRRFGRR